MCNSQTTAVWLSDQNMTFYKTRRSHSREGFCIRLRQTSYMDRFVFFFGLPSFNAKGCCGQGEDQARERLARDFRKDDSHRRSSSVGSQGWPNNSLRISHRPLPREASRALEASSDTQKEEWWPGTWSLSKARHQQAADSKRSRKCMLQSRAVKKGE